MHAWMKISHDIQKLYSLLPPICAAANLLLLADLSAAPLQRLSKSMVTPMERHGLAADDDRSLRPAYNRSQLVQAAADGLLSKVVVQLAQGAAVDARDSQGSTALLLACCGGHLQVVETLLAHSAQVRLCPFLVLQTTTDIARFRPLIVFTLMRL